MGASQSVEFSEEPCNPVSWTLDQVKDLEQVWKENCGMAFGITRDNLVTMITNTTFAKDSGIDFEPLVEDLWSRFNSGEESDLIDALGLICTMAIVSKGEFDVKSDFIFNTFDFNVNGSISRDEMTILVMSSLLGLVRYFMPGEPTPSDEVCESFSARAFSQIDKDLGGTITKDEFKLFVKQELDADGSGTLQAEELLAYFDVSKVSAGGGGEGGQEGAEGGDEGDEVVNEDSDLEDPGLLAKVEQAPVEEAGPMDMFSMEDAGAGDQFMAVKPWIGAIKAPSEPPAGKNIAPDADLELEWTYGYTSFGVRSNLRRIETGEVVYHTAAVGVVYNAAEHTQRHYFGHNDDICSLAMHPNGKFVATGEMGKRPYIHVWDATKPEGEMLIKSFSVRTLKRAVIQLAFSPDGTQLAAIGQDDDHTLHIFPNWEEGRRGVRTASTDKNKILGIAFGEGSDGVPTVATVGKRHVKYWPVTDERRIRGKKASLSKGKLQPIVSVAFFAGRMVGGTASGRLYIWDGNEMEKQVRVGRGTVYSLYAAGDVLISACRDGKVTVWDDGFSALRTIDLNRQAAVFVKPSKPISVFCGDGGADILVGTRGAEILAFPEMSDSAELLAEGHYYGELWGLAVAPDSGNFFSAGDDKVVRVWDSAERKCVARAKLDTFIRCAAYSPDGSQIAVGTGGRLGGIIPLVNGAFYILDAATLEVVYKSQPSKRWIQDIKYAPDGSKLAVGSHDSRVYLFDVAAGYTPLGTCTGHSSYITHMDFSADAANLQTNCGAYELLFWDANTGERLPSGATELRDTEWATWSCVLGWPVQGIWPPFADGTDINSVDRSHSGSMIATSDDSGKVNLFNYPCLEPGWMRSEYSGHSSHVTNVRWLHDDSKVLSAGGNDKAVFQWALEGDGGVAEEEEPEDAEEEFDIASEFSYLEPKAVAGDQSAPPPAASDDPFGMFAMEDAGAGDQFMAVKPWVGAIKAPSEPPANDPSEPSRDANLEWIHGVQMQSMRGALGYTEAGDVAYATASVGVCYNAAERTQRYFIGSHNDDIIGFAVSADGKYVATGERGRRPKIFVWDTASMSVVKCLRGHRRGVPVLAFSPDGSKLASVGLDNDHTVFVWDLASGSKLCSQKGDTNRIMAASWSPDSSLFVTVGVKHIYYWTPRRRGMRQRRGLIGSRGKRCTSLAVAFNGEGNAVVGNSNGSFYVFNADRKLERVVEGHDGPVFTMYSSEGTIFSGGRDGKVFRWDSGFAEKAGEMEFESAVRAVVAKEGKTLVGTKKSEVFEVVDGEKSLLFQGHFYGELWGLAAHPTENKYATTGDDATVRLWDVDRHEMVQQASLDTLARCAAFSADGKYLAVGLGGRLGGKEDGPTGAFVVLDGASLEVVHTARDSEQWIQDIKFSPDGATLAVASHDNHIYLYDVESGFGKKAVCSGHSSYLTHIDFTADSKFLQSTDGAYELLFWDAETGDQNPSGASELKDAEWATWTCVLGWPVQGIWPAFSDGTDINSVCRSADASLLATSDDFGKVNLYRYPALEGATGTEYLGHSSHVTNVRFTNDDGRFVTTGGNDRAIFQWTVEPAPEAADDEAVGDWGGALEVPERTPAEEAAREGVFFEMEDAGGGDEFMAVKPWIGAIKAPSDPPRGVNAPPEAELALEWVHGYRSFDVRSNLRYLATYEFVYHTAAVAVVYNPGEHTQRYFMGHTDDIVSLAVHPNGRYVATGQMGKRPTIHVWDSKHCTLLMTLSGFHKRAVSLLSFSPDGEYLASVGLDNNHSIALYKWNSPGAGSGSGSRRRRRRRRGRSSAGSDVNQFAKGTTGKALAIAFSPTEVCVVGVRTIKVYSIYGLKAKKGLMNGVGKLQPFVSAAYFNGNFVVGTASGELYQLDGRKVSRAIPAHKGTINALAVAESGMELVSGGRDGVVKLWDEELSLSEELDLNEEGSCQLTDVRSVAYVSPDGALIGTRGAEVIQWRLGFGPVTYIEGHYYGETWGLATHPESGDYCTSGDDAFLRFWSAEERTQLGKVQLSTLARAAAYSPSGAKVAVGLGGRLGGKEKGPCGGFVVVDAESMEIEHEGRDSEQWIQDLKYSPDGMTLAVASHDNKIYLYDVAGGYALRASTEPTSSYITHIDWTADSKFLQSTDGAYELLFWNAETGEQNPSGASELRDAEWATWTSVLGWPVQGIWPAFADGTDINAVERSHNGAILASADDFGAVKLFNYPCTDAGWENERYMGHSSHVTKVSWTAGDARLISTGGNDKAVFQWKATGMDPPPVDEDEAMFGLEEAAEGDNAGMDFGMDMFAMEDAGAGDEFMAVKPWIGAIKAPSDPPSSSPYASVKGDLELEWVHGYQAQYVRNSLRYTRTGDIAYTCAALGIVFDAGAHKQRFHNEATDDIISAAMSPDGRYMAVGERGRRPNIYVFDTRSMHNIATLRGHRRGVTNLAFSPNGKKLLSVGLDNDHKVIVYDVAAGTALAKAKGDTNRILACAWAPDGSGFITAGVKHIYFWEDRRSRYKKRRGRMGAGSKLQAFITCDYVGGNAVVGAADGNILVFNSDRKCESLVAAHEGPITAMYSSGNELLTGGDDCTFKVWNSSFRATEEYTMDSGVRSVHAVRGQPYLVGTNQSQIWKVNASRKTLVSEAHYGVRDHIGELWGLATNPNGGTYVTSGDDGTIRVWNTATHKLEAMTKVDALVRAVAYSPDGAMIALATGGRLGGKEAGECGTFKVLDAASLEIVHEAESGSEWIQDIKFSPDGATLAVASHDNKVYLYDAAAGFGLKAECSGHSSYITHIDFTADSKWLQSNCGAYELLFWDTESGEQNPSGASELKDAEWASWTCVLGWPVQGIWPERADGTDVNAVDNRGSLLAYADDFGKVKLFNYPCVTPGARSKVFTGHSSHVTNVRFTVDDLFLISTGGNDRGVFQWKRRG